MSAGRRRRTHGHLKRRRTKRWALLALLLVLGALRGNAQERDEPQQLTQLRKAYYERMANALRPINLQYEQQLKQLEGILERSGDSEGAEAVRQEYEAVASQPALDGERGRPRKVVFKAAKAKVSDSLKIDKGAISYWSDVDAVVEWDPCRIVPGRYSVHLTYSAGDGCGGTYSVVLNGQVVHGKAASTGNWGAYVTQKAGEVTVEATEVRVQVVAKEISTVLMNLREVILKPEAAEPGRPATAE